MTSLMKAHPPDGAAAFGCHHVNRLPALCLGRPTRFRPGATSRARRAPSLRGRTPAAQVSARRTNTTNLHPGRESISIPFFVTRCVALGHDRFRLGYQEHRPLGKCHRAPALCAAVKTRCCRLRSDEGVSCAPIASPKPASQGIDHCRHDGPGTVSGNILRVIVWRRLRRPCVGCMSGIFL